jgi:hypothetical protein
MVIEFPNFSIRSLTVTAQFRSGCLPAQLLFTRAHCATLFIIAGVRYGAHAEICAGDGKLASSSSLVARRAMTSPLQSRL